MKLFIAAVAIFSSLLAVTDASAANIRCEGCPWGSMRQVAINAGDGTHTVFSLSTNEIHAFQVEVLGAGEPANAFSALISQAQAQEFASLRGLFLESGGDMKFTIEVPVGDLNLGAPINLANWTAFDYAANPATHARFQDGVAIYANSFASLRHSGTYWQIAGSLTSVTGTQIEVVVVFAGGGRVKFVVEGGQSQGQQVGPARDASGNSIPGPTDNPSQLTGIYFFGDASAQRDFSVHLSNLGWPANWGNVGQSRPGAYTCTWHLLTAHLICVMIHPN